MTIKCSQCGTTEMEQTSVYFSAQGTLLGNWPLYYLGAKPSEPQNAEHYFCNVYCANAFVRERNDPSKTV